MTRRKLDLRVVRRALRDRGRPVLLGEAGSFRVRWVGPNERADVWERVRRRYAGPGGDADAGDHLGHEFADANGRRLVYIEVCC